MSATIVNVRGLSLPLGHSLAREPRRPPEQQPPDFAAQFDHTTLFYDVFSVGGIVFLAGPPLFNLRVALAQATWLVDGSPADRRQVMLSDVDRTQRSWINTGTPHPPEQLELHVQNLRYRTAMSGDEAGRFAGKTVLVTMSKNNEPAWIRDWIVFHRDHHAVDAVLLYDNGSDAYPLEALRSALDDIRGVSVVIVEWKYPYGPLGGHAPDGKTLPWDSDFCQYGGLEHAKVRFLRHAALVINADIDELVLCPGGEAIGSLMDRRRLDFCRYPGRWIERIPLPGRVGPPRHANFGWASSLSSPCPPKWAMRASRLSLGALQWRVHDVRGLPDRTQGDVVFRHLMGLTTKSRERQMGIADRATLALDGELVAALEKSFGRPHHSIDAAVEETSMREPGRQSGE